MQRSAQAVKKFLMSAAAVATLAGFSSFVDTAWGQGQAPAGPAARSAGPAGPAQKIGLIDMAYIFKNYKKFEALRADLKTEIDQSEVQARTKAQQIKALQDEMKDFKEGSADFLEREKKLAEATSEFETFRTVQQREFLRKESAIYKTVYLEATEAVQKFSEIYGYSLIMRFNREGLDSADDPQAIITRMNRQVIHYSPEDDITDKILGYLNRNYQAATGGTAPQPTRSVNPAANNAGGTRR
jgi:outer membrane protein